MDIYVGFSIRILSSSQIECPDACSYTFQHFTAYGNILYVLYYYTYKLWKFYYIYILIKKIVINLGE